MSSFVFVMLFWGCIIGIALMRRFIGWPTTVTLMPYQRGILFKKGYAVRDVGPGRLRVWAGMEKVIIVDTRTIPVSFENRAVTLKDGHTAVFGFSASADVQDARKALYSAQNFSQVPSYVFLICSRAVLNELASDNLKISQNAIEEEIKKRAKARLESRGFNLLTFRLTQLAIAGPAPQPQNKSIGMANA